MTPLEKANELYSKYDDLLNKDFMNPIVFDNQLKQCALIAVDNLLMCTLPSCEFGGEINDFTSEYWNKVKQEIENL